MTEGQQILEKQNLESNQNDLGASIKEGYYENRQIGKCNKM